MEQLEYLTAIVFGFNCLLRQLFRAVVSPIRRWLDHASVCCHVSRRTEGCDVTHALDATATGRRNADSRRAERVQWAGDERVRAQDVPAQPDTGAADGRTENQAVGLERGVGAIGRAWEVQSKSFGK